MSILETNWRSFLSPDCAFPPDVFFLVKTEDDENGEVPGKSIGAHRLLLAGVSPVFRGMLGGPMRETGEVIEVKETTAEAFTTMIGYIYKPPGDEFTLDEIRCPQKLYEVLALAEKYEIFSLKTLASDTLETLALTNENMIFAATVANNYKLLFTEVSTKLMVRCLKFIFDSTTGGRDVVALISETKKNFPGADLNVLHDLINVGNDTFRLPGNFQQDFFTEAALNL